MDKPSATEHSCDEELGVMVMAAEHGEIVPGVMQMNCLLTEVSLVACWINIAQ